LLVSLLSEILNFRLRAKGVKFVQKEIDKLNKFVDESNFDVVFNCVGMGAAQICDDKQMVPIRGQMIRVKAPWIKHFYYTDDNCYIIPNVDTICLGGTRQVNNNSAVNDRQDIEDVFDRCKHLCPSLKDATIEWEWAGLRPHRAPTRVEKESFTNKNNKNVTVIHNYGHGGNGIALCWGTSIHAVRLLAENNENVLSKL